MTYGSVRDLPTMQKLFTELETFRIFSWFAGRQQHQKAAQLRAELDRLVTVVDNFYALMNTKHWIFHDDMNVDDMAEIVANYSGNPDDAEQSLIAWYRKPDQLSSLILRLSWHPAWRARMDLLRTVERDYAEGRYYAAVPILLSLADGFINDIEPSKGRKGLHARNENEVDAWDSVVGHHQGLAQTLHLYQKSFSKLDETEVHEVYRNGILHGMLPNYDNVIVATKCWNLLFAVNDFAKTEKQRKDAEMTPPPPRFQDLLTQVHKTYRFKKAVESFKPYEITNTDPDFEKDLVYQACKELLTALTKRRWGLVPPLLSKISGPPSPKSIKENYKSSFLINFRIIRINHIAASICECEIELTIKDQDYRPTMRWIYERSNGELSIPDFHDGQWRSIFWGASTLVVNPVTAED